MAIKPGIGGRKEKKNPNFFSHEFVIQNHADIVSCVAMVFVVGLMVQATGPLASIFIALQHNVSGQEPSAENHKGEPFTYEPGWKDSCAVFFYTLICIIMHAILQEYVLDKISKKLHLSKFKLSRFNESGQLVVFTIMSFVWGLNVIIKEQYYGNMTKLWDDFPNHPMSPVHKFFFLIQLAYYLHMLPELYFQKVKKDEQSPKIVYSIIGFSVIAIAYILCLQRIALVLLTMHYLSEIVNHSFQLVDIFDKDEKFAKLNVINKFLFVATRFTTMVLAVITLFYGIGKTNDSKSGLIGLGIVCSLQTFFIFAFITSYLKNKRESQAVQKVSKTKGAKVVAKSGEKTKKERKKESDLPEADQQSTPVNTKKVKTK